MALDGHQDDMDRRRRRRAALEARQQRRRPPDPPPTDAPAPPQQEPAPPAQPQPSDVAPVVAVADKGPSRLGELRALVEPVAGEVVHLAEHRLAILKQEAVQGARLATREATIAAVGAGALLMGYLLLNAAVALIIGALIGGMMGLGIGALTLAALHLIVGAVAITRSARRLKEQRPWELSITRAELEKDVKWLKEIPKTKALPPAQTPPQP